MKSTIQKACLNSLMIAAAATLTLPVASIAQNPRATPPTAAEPENYQPEKYSPLRYRAIYAESAFERDILPPQKEVVVDEKPVFEMKVVSVTGNSGRYRVTMIDKKGKYVVLTDKPNAEGYYYEDIKPAPKVADVEVLVAKDGHSEWSKFDENRFKIAAKGLAPKKPTNTKGRPNVVPTSRKTPAPRTSTSKSPAAASAGQKAGTAALQAVQKANEAAKSRSSGRRVVLPPKSR